MLSIFLHYILNKHMYLQFNHSLECMYLLLDKIENFALHIFFFFSKIQKTIKHIDKKKL